MKDILIKLLFDTDWTLILRVVIYIGIGWEVYQGRTESVLFLLILILHLDVVDLRDKLKEKT